MTDKELRRLKCEPALCKNNTARQCILKGCRRAEALAKTLGVWKDKQPTKDAQ